MQLIRPNGRGVNVSLPRGFSRNDMYVSELKDFIRCIRSGKDPESDGRSGAMVLEMALAAKAASRQKRSLALTA